jgi:hypothetical protein
MELAPQVMYMHVECVAFEFAVPAVDVVDQLLAAQHMPDVFHEPAQHHEFAPLQVDHPAVDADGQCRRVDLDAAVADDVDHRAARAAFQHPQPGEQLVQVERLGEIVVGAGIQPADALQRRVARAQHEYRRGDTRFARPAQHFHAVEPRQPEVEDGEIDP